MSKGSWNVPQTEQGLQEVIGRIGEYRATGDQLELGNGLLELSHLVKWVRSDNDLPPFVRSHQLALEALEAFRSVGDAAGQARALVVASAMADPQTRNAMLTDAEQLAEITGNEDYVAMVLAARGRGAGLSDQGQALEYTRRAMAIYRRSGNRTGLAQCLFSLAIKEEGNEVKRDHALEAADVYRTLENFKEAARCTSLAFMYAKSIQPLEELDSLARQGLQDAQQVGDRAQEGHFYSNLSLIAISKGEPEEAEKYRRWAAELQDSDGLTAYERWESNVEMSKQMVAVAKAQGNREAEAMFKAELKRLKSNKPARTGRS